MNAGPTPGRWLSLSRTLALYQLEARLDLITLWRTPGFILPCLLFPLVFYSLFGVMLNQHGQGQAAYLLVSYGAFGVMGPALFNFGANIASEKAQGWLMQKFVSPAPVGSWLFGKTMSCLMLAALILLLLFGCAALAAGVVLPRGQWLGLFAVLLLGTVPFCLLGLWLGLTLSAKSAPATINLIYLPLAFLGGLWLPISMLPGLLQQFALLLPSFHLANLGRLVVEQQLPGEMLVPAWLSVAVLLAYSLLFAVLARRCFYGQSRQRQ